MHGINKGIILKMINAYGDNQQKATVNTKIIPEYSHQ